MKIIYRGHNDKSCLTHETFTSVKETDFFIELTDAASKLNLILNKENSELPEKDYDLKTGDLFSLSEDPGSVIYIDKNYLLLYRTNTGYLSLKRLYRDYIEPEINYIGFDDDDEVINWEEIQDISSLDQIQNGLNYGEIYILKKKILNQTPESSRYIKINLTCSIGVVYPVIFDKQSSSIYYDKDEFMNEDQVKYILKRIVGNSFINH